MYKNYKMTKHTLLMETSVLIPTNDIVETTPRLNSMNSFVWTIKD